MISFPDLPVPSPASSTSEKKEGESGVKEVYILLMRLPNDIGLRALFPQVPSICLELSCVGRANYLGSEILGLPVHIRYDRFLSQCRNDAGEEGHLRLDIHVSIKTHSPRLSVSSDTFYDLRNAGLGPPRWFRQANASGEYEQMRCGVLYSYVKSYVREYQGDLKAINRRLWMASKRSQSMWMVSLLSEQSNIHS